MFEAQAIEISLQAGSMVGVEKEERIATPWYHSLKLRHPWLQLNLSPRFSPPRWWACSRTRSIAW